MPLSLLERSHPCIVILDAACVILNTELQKLLVSKASCWSYQVRWHTTPLKPALLGNKLFMPDWVPTGQRVSGAASQSTGLIEPATPPASLQRDDDGAGPAVPTEFAWEGYPQVINCGTFHTQ